jgi:hypothetical protein
MCTSSQNKITEDKYMSDRRKQQIPWTTSVIIREISLYSWSFNTAWRLNKSYGKEDSIDEDKVSELGFSLMWQLCRKDESWFT